MRKVFGRTLLVLSGLLLLWSAWSVFDLVTVYQSSVAKQDYTGFGLTFTFYSILLWSSALAALLGGLALKNPRVLPRLNLSVRMRKLMGVLLISGAVITLLALLQVGSLLVGEFFSYARSLEDVAFGLTLFAVSALPLLIAGTLLSIIGAKLIRGDWAQSAA